MPDPHPDWDLVLYLFFGSAVTAATAASSSSCCVKWDQLRKYLQSHDINDCIDQYGNTLLIFAVQSGNANAIINLSYLSIDPNIHNIFGYTALDIARDMRSPHLDILQQYHPCIDFDDVKIHPTTLNALFAAIYHGDCSHFGHGSDLSQQSQQQQSTQQQQQQSQQQSQHKPTFYEPSLHGWTPLMCAVRYGQAQCIKTLCQSPQHFPLFSTTDDDRRDQLETLFDLAITHGHSECIIALVHYVLPLIQLSPSPPSLSLQYDATNQNDTFFLPSSALALAISTGHNECIPILYKYFPTINPNEQDINGDTALLFTAKRHSCSIPSLSFLHTLFPTINPNQQNNRGDTVLLLAIRLYCNPIYLSQLIQTFPNIDPTIRNCNGESPLLIACMNYSIPHISILLQAYPNIDPNVYSHDGNSPLLLTTQGQNIEMMSLLCHLCPMININHQNNEGITALMLVIQSQNIQLFHVLLELLPYHDSVTPPPPPPTTITTSTTPPPSIIFSQQFQPGLRDVLTGSTAMIYLAKYGDIEYMHLYKQYCPISDVSIPDNLGNTPLHIMIIENRHITLITTFITLFHEYIDCNASNYHGETILMTAISRSRTDVMTVLCELFPTINLYIQDIYGKTAFYYCLRYNNYHCLVLFHNLWPLSQFFTIDYFTIFLHDCIQYCHIDIIQTYYQFHTGWSTGNERIFHQTLVLQSSQKQSNGSSSSSIRSSNNNINSIDSGGATVLGYAIQCGRSDIISFLCETFQSTIDINAIDRYGYSPFLRAIEFGSEYLLTIIFRYIPLYRINMNIITLDNHSIYSIIIQKQHFHLFQLLLRQHQQEQQEQDQQQQFTTTPTTTILNPNICHHQGETPLMIAIRYSSIPSIKALAQYPNINPNCLEDFTRNSLLMLAMKTTTTSFQNHIAISDIVQTLYTYFPSIDVNITNRFGQTALMAAIQQGRGRRRGGSMEITKTLIDCYKSNINPSIQDVYGNTALLYAVIEQSPQIIQLLSQHFSASDLCLHHCNLDKESAWSISLQQHDHECTFALLQFHSICLLSSVDFLRQSIAKNDQIAIMTTLIAILDQL